MKIARIGSEGRDSLIKGMDFVAEPVMSTLGPYGQNFLIEKGNKVTNDGITIARELSEAVEDDIERRGAKYLVESADKANDMIGDCSTTSVTLIHAISHEAKKYLGSGAVLGNKRPPSELARTIEKERKEVTEKLLAIATPIETEEQLIEAATVSTEDKELGEIIGKAQFELGKDGVLIPELTNDTESSVVKISGIVVDNGFGTVAVVNNAEQQSLELKDVPIIYTSHTLKKLDELQHILVPMINQGHRDIVLMTRAFTDECIRECMENFKSGVHIYPLNAPYVDQTEIMKDMQAVLGGQFLGVEETSLKDALPSCVGHASKIIAKRSSTIIAGNGDTTARIAELEEKKKGSPSDFEKKNLATRIAQLKGGFGIIRIGGKTEKERKYRYDKAEDAANAVRSAFQEGVVKGAGLALKQISEELPEDYLLKAPLLAPYKQIMANAGAPFDVEEWVKDPVRGLRIALEIACSAASVFITAGGAITTKTEKKNCCSNNGNE